MIGYSQKEECHGVSTRRDRTGLNTWLVIALCATSYLISVPWQWCPWTVGGVRLLEGVAVHRGISPPRAGRHPLRQPRPPASWPCSGLVEPPRSVLRCFCWWPRGAGPDPLAGRRVARTFCVAILLAENASACGELRVRLLISGAALARLVFSVCFFPRPSPVSTTPCSSPFSPWRGSLLSVRPVPPGRGDEGGE
jgi:hypothetical protein